MAIIYTYPIVAPTSNDLVLGTDVDAQGKPTKNFTVQSIIDLATVSGNDLQAVLDNGNSATQNIVLTGNISATRYTDGTMVLAGGIGSGFTSLTSVDFLGDITGILKAGSSIQSTVTGVTQPLGTNNTTLATTAFVMSKVDPSVLQYLGDATGPFDLNLVTDDFKISGTANQIETTATTVGGNVGTINLKFPTTGVTLPDGSIATTQALTDNSTKIATTAFVHGKNDAQDLDFTGDTGTSLVVLNSQTLNFEGTTDQITTAVSAQKVKFTLPTNVTIGGIFTGVTFSGDLNGTVNTATVGTTQTAGDNSTKIATTEYVDSAAGSKTLSYKDTSATINTMNLTDDDLQFTGGSNITSTATAVATNIADIKFDLDNSVTISGTMKADTFTTTAGTATWVTTVLDGFTAITSDLFTGPLTGNADTATALASSGAISLTGDTESTGGPHTYTSGGAVTIPTTIANTTVTAKTLFNLATPTSAAISAGDTILAAMAKLQGQIDGIAGSLAFEGTWDASTGNPPSATPLNGQFWIVSVAGSTDLSGITDWLVGDWAIYVNNGAGTDAWQKLDQSNEVLGSGTAQKMAMWSGTVGDASQTLATGLIEQNAANNLITIGNSGSLLVEGNTTLGNADTDTTTVKGPAIFEFATRFNEGISLGAATYGTAGQVLTSGGGSASVNTWTTPTTGTVTSVGLTETGDAITITGSPVTSSGTINIAGAGASASQYINGELNLVTFPTVDNYVSWTADSDEGTDITVTSGFNLKFTGAVTAGGAGIATDSAVSANEMTIGLINAGGTPGTTTFYRGDGQWSVPVGTKTETLEEVLGNGNTSGANDIVMADSQKITFGAAPDLQLFHDTSNSYIETTSGSAGDLYIKSNGTGHDLYLQATDDVFIRPQSSNDGIKVIGGGAVELYHNNMKTFETESNGVNIDTDFTYSRISLKGSGTTYGTVQGDSTNGLLLRSGGNSNQGLAINGYNSTFLGSWGGGVSGTVMKVEAFFPKVEIGDSTNFGNGNLTDLEVWGDVDVKGKITGSSSGVSSLAGRKFAYVSKALTVAGSWTDMFSLSGVFIGVISEVFGQCNSYGSITKSEALSYHVAQAGGSSGSVANTPVYNKIIDTGPGSAASFELQFLAYNASSNKHGYKCQARALTANSTVDISVNWMDSTVNNHTFTDLT